jgi:glycosyltransferase involved in cell wall biosynthesis
MIVFHISQAGGGVKTYIDNIATHNPDKKRYKHYLITGKDYILPADNIFEKCYIIDTLVRAPGIYKDAVTVIKILKILKEVTPDVIHCHSAKGGVVGRIVGRICNVPTVFTPNAFSYLGYEGLKSTVFKFIEKATKFNSSLLGVAKSEAEKAIIDVGYKREKAFVVENYIKAQEHNKRNYELRQNVGMIGRLTFQKNPLLYFEMARRVSKVFPNVKFTLLGAGYHDHLIKEVDEFISRNNLNDTIEIKNWASYPNINDFYNSIDVFVLTSKYEGLSFSLLEAMSLGLPVMVTDVVGNKDVIRNSYRNGFISNDVDFLVESLVDLLGSLELRTKYGQNAHKYVFEFHNVSNADKIYKLYNYLANKDNSAVVLDEIASLQYLN